jgi:hypothetical protein
MPSPSPRGEASRRRAEERFKSAKTAAAKTSQADHLSRQAERQAEAEKTARLRGLRLAKEAADKETADREAAAVAVSKIEPRRRAPKSTPASP